MSRLYKLAQLPRREPRFEHTSDLKAKEFINTCFYVPNLNYTQCKPKKKVHNTAIRSFLQFLLIRNHMMSIPEEDDDCIFSPGCSYSPCHIILVWIKTI